MRGAGIPLCREARQAPQGHRGDTCLHLFTTGSSAASQVGEDGGERASRGILAETKLPLGLTSTDLSASSGLGAGCCCIWQPGFLRSLLPATASLG